MVSSVAAITIVHGRRAARHHVVELDLVAGFQIDLTGFGVNDIFCAIFSDDLFVGNLERLYTFFLDLANRTCGQFFSKFGDHVAGIAIEDDDLVAAGSSPPAAIKSLSSKIP